MGRYSISDLEKISGIKAHTIRIWEQRYGLLKPQRTDTNIRFYDDFDLKLLLNISMLTLRGMRISRIAEMSESEIMEQVTSVMENCGEYLTQVNSLLLATLELDEPKFEKVFATCTVRFGFEHTITKVIYPLFTRIGIYWQTGTVNPAQEHFLSMLVRQKIISAIDGIISIPGKDSAKFLLFLPEGEHHEIPLLFCSWWLRSHGQQVVYLGQSVPIDDLFSVVKIHEPDYLFTVITTRLGQDCPDDYINEVSRRLGKGVLLATGAAALGSDCACLSNVKKIYSPADLEQVLNKRSQN